MAYVGDAEQAKPHLEHNPLSLLGVCNATPMRKLNDPEADLCGERAVAFLQGHNIVAQAHALATSAPPAHVLLEHVQQVDASLLVIGAYGRSTLREFFGGSLTRTMLRESPVPLFLYH